jgi:hypothetical protein
MPDMQAECALASLSRRFRLRPFRRAFLHRSPFQLRGAAPAAAKTGMPSRGQSFSRCRQFQPLFSALAVKNVSVRQACQWQPTEISLMTIVIHNAFNKIKFQGIGQSARRLGAGTGQGDNPLREMCCR